MYQLFGSLQTRIGQIMDVYPLIGGTYDLLIQEWLKPPNTYHYTFPSIDMSDDLRRKFEFWKFNGSENMTKKTYANLWRAHCFQKSNMAAEY